MHVLVAVPFPLIYILLCLLFKFLDEIQCTNKMQLQATAVYNPLFLFLSHENTLLCLALLFSSM